MKLKKSIGLFCLLAVLLVSFVSQASAENVKFKTGKCSFSLPVYGAYEKFEADWKGPCLNGLAEGEGLITYSIEFTDKTKYEVEGKVAMKQGLLDGRGVLNFSNGDRYDLNFVGGEPKNGTVVRSDGRKYEGEFYKDYAHGKGSLPPRTARAMTAISKWTNRMVTGFRGTRTAKSSMKANG